MLYAITTLKTTYIFMELLYSDMVLCNNGYWMFSCLRERNREKLDLRSLEETRWYIDRVNSCRRMVLTYKYFFSNKKITNLGILERKTIPTNENPFL